MGLDMYLEANIYTGGGYQFIRESDTDRAVAERKLFDAALRAVGVKRGEFPEIHSATISLEVGYWRKANAIHQWFVTNIADGVDDCSEMSVTRDQLQALLDISSMLLATAELGEPVEVGEPLFGTWTDYPNATLDTELAKSTLPPQEGFFFGPTELNYGYIYDLELTVKQLTAILDHPKLKSADFTYRASW